LPGINTLRRYDAAWLPRDIFAGLVLAAMEITAENLSWPPGKSATRVPVA
jgi:hypothetical protein